MKLEQAISLIKHDGNMIETLETLLKTEGITTFEAWDESIALACEVMQREVDRQNGCDWCEDESQAHKYWICWGCRPKACPMCGRQLKGSADNE